MRFEKPEAGLTPGAELVREKPQKRSNMISLVRKGIEQGRLSFGGFRRVNRFHRFKNSF